MQTFSKVYEKVIKNELVKYRRIISFLFKITVKFEF